MATYDSLRRQLRTLESSLDAKLTTYSKLASSIPRQAAAAGAGPGPGGSAYEPGRGSARGGTEELEEEIGGMVDRVRGLSRILSTPSAPSGPSVAHAVQRHREVLQDYTRDFRRTKQNVQTALEQANLLGSVRGEIENYKTSRTSTTDALLSERGHIDSSHRMADELLQHAHDTRAEFRQQARMLGGVQQRMTGVLSDIPGINNILGLIQTRRRRDAVIMGVLIAVCIIVLWHYMGR
ncbi:28 kda golgi snare protein [Calocera cornea HHB12733]|uniref:Golgi SNAP receptor complex member 1 n=1 Tax=Calocera cornea HHB12733 TaxID=1353952 RepID=A0A165E5F3_9BASI|nr:28 kda golgi snare protein [Calocera cornea HHB12733]